VLGGIRPGGIRPGGIRPGGIRPGGIRPGDENAPMPANPARLVYGTILVATLLSAESVKQETYPKTIGAVAIALLLYWVANSYAEFTGDRIEQGEHFTYAGLFRNAIGELALLYGAAVPLLVLLIGWATRAPLSSAVSAAIWTAAAMIVVTEIVIGVRAQLTGRELIRQSAFGVLLGLLVIAVRVLLH
jgi:hypothetical protein